VDESNAGTTDLALTTMLQAKSRYSLKGLGMPNLTSKSEHAGEVGEVQQLAQTSGYANIIGALRLHMILPELDE
jgi:hypothetical protein